MNRLLIFAIFDNQHLAAHAQGQTPNAAELAQKKVVSIIGGDKAKTQTYCQSWPRPLQRCRGLLFRANSTANQSKKFHLNAEKSPRSRRGIVAMAEDDSDVWMQRGVNHDDYRDI